MSGGTRARLESILEFGEETRLLQAIFQPNATTNENPNGTSLFDLTNDKAYQEQVSASTSRFKCSAGYFGSRCVIYFVHITLKKLNGMYIY
ncbi:uncharacterized protein LOC126600423 isoform X2 [Malus sylvestris]|nr:uncharacterized protein LOC126600423 isoform X2 [Malus sylvestris]